MPGRAVHRWAVCALLLMAAVCVSADTARAQQEALAYEKQLDLKLNPTLPPSPPPPPPPPPPPLPLRSDDSGPPAVEPDASFYEQVVSLPALFSDTDAGGNRVG